MMEKILIIDDEALIRESVAEILELQGYQTLTAEDGEKGLLTAHEESPDLIIMDVMMPGLDGFSLVQHLRKNPAFKLTPIIFISAKAKPEDLRTGMDLGADDYITKPFTTQVLLKAVESKLDKYKQLKESVLARKDYSVHKVFFKVSHEVNTSLNGILGSVNILEEFGDDMDEEERKQMLESIRISAHRIGAVFENNQWVKRISAADLGEQAEYFQHEHQINTLFSETLWARFAKEDRNRVVLDLQEGNFNLDIDVARKIVSELLSNAFKFSPSFSSVHVSGELKAHGYKLTFINEGQAFEVIEEELLHMYHQPNREELEQQGMGVGLFIVISLLKFLQIPYKIQSKEKSTSFSFLLS